MRFADGDLATASFSPASTPTNGDDYLVGTAGRDTINGLDGDDTIAGLAGKDQLDGGAGDDLIDAGPGPNKVTGGAGNDTIDGGTGPGDSAIYSGNRADYDVVLLGTGSIQIADLRGGSPDGTDLVKNIETFTFADGSILTDNLFGPAGGTATEGPDSLFGTSAADIINGLGGDDTITGFAGKDSLLGGAGDDSIVGGDGNDKITGGAGADRMSGGTGNETYLYKNIAESTPDAPDIIIDFAPGLDRISLRAAAKNLNFIGHTSNFTSGPGNPEHQVRWETSGPDTWVFVDANGDGQADMQITLLRVSSVSATDFLL
jgi:Ca2+-binding RTX toxin-like protein